MRLCNASQRNKVIRYWRIFINFVAHNKFSQSNGSDNIHIIVRNAYFRQNDFADGYLLRVGEHENKGILKKSDEARQSETFLSGREVQRELRTLLQVEMSVLCQTTHAVL